ncbi:MAG: transglutaminase family protein [Planctomycetes bacterium]|nr:transglutaminase family protein [Planctomycetota bacterium]
MTIKTTENCFEEFLRPTEFIRSDDPETIAMTERITAGLSSDREKAVALFYFVRDDVRYNPYRATVDRESLASTFCLREKEGFCVQKAVLYAAMLRAAGVPAKVGFADVRNHLASKRLLEIVRHDLFVFHGYVKAFIEGRWVSATPTFDKRLCEKSKVKTLEFDGMSDSIFHPFDHEGRRHMEYVNYHGEFADLPHEMLVEKWRVAYPYMFEDPAPVDGDLGTEIEADLEGK